MRHFVVVLIIIALTGAATVATEVVLAAPVGGNDKDGAARADAPSAVRAWIEKPVKPRPCSALVRGGSTGAPPGTGDLRTAVVSNLLGSEMYDVKWVAQEPVFVNPDGSWDTQITFRPCEHIFFTTFRVCPTLYDGESGSEHGSLPGKQVGECVEVPSLDWNIRPTPADGWWEDVRGWVWSKLDIAVTAAITAAITLVVTVWGHAVIRRLWRAFMAV